MDPNPSKLWEMAEDRGAWRAAVHGVTKSRPEQHHIGVSISHVLPHLVSLEEGLEATPPLAMSTLSTRDRFLIPILL